MNTHLNIIQNFFIFKLVIKKSTIKSFKNLLICESHEFISHIINKVTNFIITSNYCMIKVGILTLLIIFLASLNNDLTHESI
jgi:hypothetical protein